MDLVLAEVTALTKKLETAVSDASAKEGAAKALEQRAAASEAETVDLQAQLKATLATSDSALADQRSDIEALQQTTSTREKNEL